MWKLVSLLLVLVPAVLAADDTVTKKVFFDIEVDGEPAGKDTWTGTWKQRFYIEMDSMI
jgi:hypothetical protein